MPIVTYSDVLALPSLDYIIVGGGTAGLVVAARLSENRDVSVLVIEAGLLHGSVPEIDVPGFMGRAVGNPQYDWSFRTVPQVHANNRSIPQPRGKGLGGSSVLSFMGMFRPSQAEMNALGELGNEGWNWDSVLHYMKKSETLHPSGMPGSDMLTYAADPDPACHGNSGPIQLSFGPSDTMGDLNARLFDTVATLGVPRAPEKGDGKRNDGSMTCKLAIDSITGKRSYATSAYLEPILSRENLLVLTNAQVTKLLLKDQRPLQRAVGVEFVQNGSVLRLENVKGEVILAGGTYQTPQILELSGIGNPDILTKYGIDTLVSLPGVGENLQDHLGLTTIVEVETDQKTTEDLEDPAFFQAQQALYRQQQGLLTAPTDQAFVFLSADNLGKLSSWQDHIGANLGEALAQSHPALLPGLRKQYEIHQKLIADKEQAQAELILFFGRQPTSNGTPPPIPGTRSLSLVCALSHPLSRGTVHIASTDPLAPPAIDPKYFAIPADLDHLVHLLEYTLLVERTAPLGDIMKRQVMPSLEVITKGREGLVEYAKQNARQIYHPVGTAAMMPREDGGVVNPRLKVYGTSSLRVVDLSIMPFEPVCHTLALAYAIAEKAADMIEEDMPIA